MGLSTVLNLKYLLIQITLPYSWLTWNSEKEPVGKCSPLEDVERGFAFKHDFFFLNKQCLLIFFFVCDIVIQGYLTMDVLISVISFEPLKNILHYVFTTPENQTTLLPSHSCLELKK